MSDPLAPPRFVHLPSGRPLSIVPPSRELAQELCGLREQPPPGEPYIPGSAVLDLVLRRCLGVPDAFGAALLESDAGDPRGVMAHPDALYRAVRAIAAAWPRHNPWHGWRVFVERCADAYLVSYFPHLRLTDKALNAAMLDIEEQEAADMAEAWLASKPVATPELKPREAPAEPARRQAPKLKRTRGDTDERATTEYMKNPSLTLAQLAEIVGCDPSTMRNAKRCPKLAKAREAIGNTRLDYRNADVHRDREGDD